MQFGVGLVGEHRPCDMRELVRLCEQLGFDTAWFTDERFHRDAFVNMTAAAIATERLAIGCMVTDPFIRHPALTAAAAASLDDLSGGRFTLGLGAGISGFSELGIVRTRPARAIRESIDLINRLTSGEQDIRLCGEIIEFGPGQLDFLPERRTPIFVAGRGPRVLEAAGALADGVVVGSYANETGIRWALAQAARGVKRSGRNIETLDKVSWLYTSVSKDRHAALDAVRVGVAVALLGSHDILDQIGVELPAAVLAHMRSTGYRFDRSTLMQLGAMLPDELIKRFSVAGTLSDVVEQLAEIRELGMTQAALWPFPATGASLHDLLRVLGEDVLPVFRD
jgi:5,10-methylenetetrahydromethanopterin reductase